MFLTLGVPAPESKVKVQSEEAESQYNSTHEIKRRAVGSSKIRQLLPLAIASKCTFVADCLRTLYIMAFTSGLTNADSHTHHNIEIVIRNSQNAIEPQHEQLYNRRGNDMMRNKGDLWTISFSDFHFSDSCIRLRQIQSVSITENGNDGWNIRSILTLVQDSYGGVQMLTQDLNANRWIDGNGNRRHQRFQLVCHYKIDLLQNFPHQHVSP